MTVVRLTEHTDRDVESVLTYLLDRARRGRIRGLLFAYKSSNSATHRFGFAGQYWHDPMTTLGVATRLEYRINCVIDERDNEPETTTMPL